MKSPEFMPRKEEVREEDERLYKNDPGMDVKKGKGSKFVPTEDIPDGEEDEENKIADLIDNNVETESERYGGAERLKQQIINSIKSKEKIGFLQNDEDVAHVGPEFPEEKKILIKKATILR